METRVEEEEESGRSGRGRVKKQEVSRLMHLGAILLTSAHEAASVRCRRKTKCTRKCVNKKKKRAAVTHFLCPPESWRQFASFHSVVLFISAADNCVYDQESLYFVLLSVFLFSFVTLVFLHFILKKSIK